MNFLKIICTTVLFNFFLAYGFTASESDLDATKEEALVAEEDIKKEVAEQNVSFDNNVSDKSSNLDLQNIMTSVNELLFDQLLNKDFKDLDDKKLALSKRYQLRAKLSSFLNEGGLKNVEFWQCLINTKRVIDSKVEILLASNDCFVSEKDINKLKLYSFCVVYDHLNKLWGNVAIGIITLEELTDQYINNKYLTNVFSREIKNCLNNKISSQLSNLLRVDLYNLWQDLYGKYEKVILNYRENKINLDKLDPNFDNDLTDLLLQLNNERNDLLTLKFVTGFKKLIKKITCSVDKKKDELKESIKLFDLFIGNLIDIQGDLFAARKINERVKNFNPSKKMILIKTIVLQEDEDFNNLIEQPNFNQYKRIVEEYLNNDKISEGFSFELLQLKLRLEKLKEKMEPNAALVFLGFCKKTKAVCSLLKNMIEILNDINSSMEQEKKGIIDKGEQFFNKIINGEVKLPEKLTKVIWSLIQSAIG